MGVMGVLGNLVGWKSRSTQTSAQRKSSLRVAPQLTSLEDRLALTGGISGAPVVEGPPPVFNAAIHSEVLTRVNGLFTTVSADIGTVTAATSDTISMSRADGSTLTLSYSSSTIFTNGGFGKIYSAQSLVGKQEEVLSVKGKAYQGFSPNANFLGTQTHNVLTYYSSGVTYKETLDYGTVTDITGNTMTILRGDGSRVTATLSSATKVNGSTISYSPGQISRGQHILLEQMTQGEASRVTIYGDSPGSFASTHPDLFPKLV